MSEFALSVDHRVADGRLVSDFHARPLEILEDGEWRT
jgi:pyruvate/2-oxoglutarate dehydrogenase complex dihydrolipoamide acyltransferase (E2) component